MACIRAPRDRRRFHIHPQAADQLVQPRDPGNALRQPPRTP